MLGCGNMTAATELSTSELRKLVQTEFEYKPSTYWIDFLACTIITWSAFVGMQFVPVFSWLALALFFTAVFAGLRAVLFVHEIAHFKQDSVPGFALAWNLLMGIPNFVPSFMYRGVHNDQHSKLLYGTKDDGEYVPFGAESPKRILLYLATTAISPLLLPLRYIVLAPLSWTIPGFRKIVVGQLSSLVIDFEYIRGEVSPAERRDWHWQETVAFIFGATIVVLIAYGVLPWTLMIYYYFYSFAMFVVNSIRTVAAHRYAHTGERMSMQEQFLDSVNVTSNSLLTTLFCPVGLRYHALHHLFPTMPYHSLERAHGKLMAALPADSSYRLANEPSLASAVFNLWNAARASEGKPRLAPAGRVSLMPNFLRKKSSETQVS